jgi:hypothetical protein
MARYFIMLAERLFLLSLLDSVCHAQGDVGGGGTDLPSQTNSPILATCSSIDANDNAILTVCGIGGQYDSMKANTNCASLVCSEADRVSFFQ